MPSSSEQEFQHQLESMRGEVNYIKIKWGAERKQWDEERARWEKERAEWEREKANWELEREKWAREKESHEREKSNFKEERAMWMKERLSLYQDIQNAYSSASALARDSLKQYFSESQVEFFLKGKPIAHWGEDDISKALTLRSLSPKAYRYLRENCKFPFPSFSTMNRWVNKLDIEPGILRSYKVIET